VSGIAERYSLRPAAGAADFEAARELFLEYAAWLQEDLCFQGFEQELATLPGKYAPPDGRLFLACRDGKPIGCVALRRFDAESGNSSPTCSRTTAVMASRASRCGDRPHARSATAGWCSTRSTG
jgi:hypothetical protein